MKDIWLVFVALFWFLVGIPKFLLTRTVRMDGIAVALLIFFVVNVGKDNSPVWVHYTPLVWFIYVAFVMPIWQGKDE